MSAWHPRGEPTWPDWKKAEPGTRIEHVRSGRQGTFVKAYVGTTKSARWAVIDWDPMPPFSGGRPIRGRVVAPAFDLRPIEED